MNREQSSPGLGTFGGVFVPNVLTILGVILFMRTGWVVGHAGFWGAMAILTIANIITLLTALSLSALSTNTQVGAGGAYFITSRSLGVEIGGSIGVPLYFAQAVSVAFYLVGFAESLEYVIPGVDRQMVCLVMLGLFIGVAWFGAGVIAKTQYFILGALLISLVSLFAGYRPLEDLTINLQPHYTDGQSFWSVFAIFFPAVTGIMSGVSMSGDLAEPSKAIPRGTIAAVLCTFVVYALAIALLAFGSDPTALQEQPLIMKEIALYGPLIFVGLWAATLSSALASLAAAPRTLQALAVDNVAPSILGRRHGTTREPRIALVLSGIVAAGCVMIGELDLIAPIISMFFLATYGTLNIVAGLEALVANPSYRPAFRVHWLLSILGGLGCVGVMCLIDPIATAASTVVIIGIYTWLTRRRLSGFVG